MKIVLNKCYGGFGVSSRVSSQCMWELIKKKSKSVEICSFKEWYGKDWKEKLQGDLERIEEWKTKFPNEKCVKFSKKIKKPWIVDVFSVDLFYNMKTKKVYNYDSSYDYESRTDPYLIKLIETKGSEWCSGNHANLKVVEIPDGVKWEISEYDGVESVEEKHRVFG